MAQLPQYQRFIVDLPAATARNVLAFLGINSGYADLSELIAVALENQLRLEATDVPLDVQALPTNEAADVTGLLQASQLPGPTMNRPPSKARLKRPRSQPNPTTSKRTAPRKIIDEQEALGPLAKLDLTALLGIPDASHIDVGPADSSKGGTSLTPFTNRLNPVVVPLRILANATALLGALAVGDFLHAVPVLARDVGLRLKREDELNARRGRQRRSTGWPLGDDEVASLSRFRTSFLLKEGSDGGLTGPLVDLGLVALSDGLLLTRRGLEIAAEKTPMLGETQSERLLSERQCQLFQEALLALPGEREEVRLFLKAVAEGGGGQTAIDRMIQEAHSTWTDALVVSHRAAMVGRLRDVGIVDALPAKPGEEVSIVLEPQAYEFEELLRRAE